MAVINQDNAFGYPYLCDCQWSYCNHSIYKLVHALLHYNSMDLVYHNLTYYSSLGSGRTFTTNHEKTRTADKYISQ